MSIVAAYGAFLGLTGVTAGAFGSHYLRSRMTEDRQRSWQIATQYQLLHAVLTFTVGMHAVASGKKSNGHLNRALYMWCAGTTVFSGSIYLLFLGYKGILGPLTPVGGLILMGGWGSAILAALTL